MKTLPLLILLAVTGCHHSYDLAERRYQVTAGFSDADFAVMQREADALCAITDRCVYLTRDHSWNRIIVGSLSSTCPEKGGCYGEFSDGTRAISITPNMITDGRLAEAFRHEMGHAAGCWGPSEGNLSDPGNVMYGQIDDVAWTESDLDCIEGVQ